MSPLIGQEAYEYIRLVQSPPGCAADYLCDPGCPLMLDETWQSFGIAECRATLRFARIRHRRAEFAPNCTLDTSAHRRATADARSSATQEADGAAKSANNNTDKTRTGQCCR